MGIRQSLRAAALVVAIGGGSVAMPGVAQADVPASICGAVVTANLLLTGNLSCPSGDGITIAAPVTIDLGGFVLSGSADAVGITVAYPNSVTIRHGRLSGWRTAVAELPLQQHLPSLPFTSNLTAVTFMHNGTGLLVRAPDAIGEIVPGTWTVDRSWFVANGTGIDNGSVNSVAVRKSSFSKNTVAIRQAAEDLDDGGLMSISATKFTSNATGVLCSSSGCGLTGNTFVDNPTAVRSVDEFTALTMTGNAVTGGTTGVDVIDNLGVDIRDNVFTGAGSALTATRFNGTIAGNQFMHNGTGLTADLRPTYPMHGTPTITGNRASSNSGTGITVLGPANVGSNASDSNGGRGIYASGVTDLGGNSATGNTTHPQCLGVVC